MKSCPSGNRKRTSSKNRAVIGSHRLRQADKLADGQIRGKTWHNGLVHAEIQCQGDGTEHRVSALRVDHVGAGTAQGVVMLKRCSDSKLKYRCRILLELFGAEWATKARFANCRFTVADVLMDDVEPHEETLWESVLKSTDKVTGRWQLVVPYWATVLDDRFQRDWYIEFIQTDLPDFSSGQKSHLQKVRTVRENWDCRDTV